MPGRTRSASRRSVGRAIVGPRDRARRGRRLYDATTVPDSQEPPRWPSSPAPSRTRSSSPAAGSSRDDPLVVANPADPTTPAGSTFHATEAQYEEAVEAAVAAFEVTRTLPAYERGRILREISAGIKARREELGRLIALEAGKPIRDALVEVDRATLTFRLGAEEAERMTGEVIPLDLLPSSQGPRRDHAALPDRPDRGDQPVQLPAQPRRPQARAGDRHRQPDRPQAAVQGPARDAHGRRDRRGGRRPGRARCSILPMTRELGDRMVADERFKLLTFTGSPSVGWRMKERAGKKKVVLELGGNAGVIVDKTRRPRLGRQAHPRRRLRLCRPGLHQRPAGVHPRGHLGRVHGQVRRGREGAQGRRPARPDDRRRADGRCARRRRGPSAGSTRRSRWAARSSLGGTADGTFFPPTILTDVPTTAQVCSNEAFAPLVVAVPVPRPRRGHRPGQRQHVRAADRASSPTTWPGAWRAFGELEVGGVIVNDIPTYRIDHMPYGGVKDSGLGREGLRWAIEDMTEIRIMVLAQPG